MAAKTLKVELLYDFWPEEDARRRAGEVIELPEKQAAELVNGGKAKLVVG